MTPRRTTLVALLLAGTSAVVTTSAARADAVASAPSQDAKIEALEQQIQDLASQVQDLKRSTADQYTDVQNQQAQAVQVSIKNARPTISSPDGKFTLAFRSLVQYDSAYYAQGKMPPGIDFSSGNDFRRARFGFEGTAFGDWSYQFIYDFGGSGIEASTISSAFIQYNGLGLVHFKIGAYAPPESFEDSTSASDLLFLERAQPTDLARGIAGSDGRDSATVFAFDDNYFAALSYTGSVVGDAATFDEQQALVGRVAYRLFSSADYNLALGADTSYVLKAPDLAAGPDSATSFRLRERPELNVDSESLRLIDTGALNIDTALEYGLEATGNWKNFYAQGGYFGFSANRRDSSLADPNFDGWYVQGSWVLTGESKNWKPEIGAYGLPKPEHPFSLTDGGLGALELATRYSEMDLNFRPGLSGFSTPKDGIRGGDQKIWTVGLNWYPNSVIRFLLDYQHTDVSRLGSAGGSLDARLDAVSLRAQLAF